MRKHSFNQLFKRIISTALTLSIAITPITAQADSEYIGGVGGAAGGGNATYTDGVSQNKSALLAYTLDADGHVTDDTPIVIFNEAQYNAWNNSYKTEPIKTKFDNGGEENISTVKIAIPNIILHKNGAWISNWYAIREYWDGNPADPTDEGIKEQFLEAMRQKGTWSEAIEMYDNGEPFYIALETIAWSGKYVNGESEGKLASTAAGWANFYKDKGMTYADASMKSFYSAGLPFSLTLDRTMFGWSKPSVLSGYVTNEDIRSKGYGINFILVNGTERRTTVTPQPAPADVESPTPTNLSVVKVYESVNAETQEITTEGVYITNDAYPQLSVDTEEQWDIISAETVSPLITSIDANDTYETIISGTTTKQEFSINSLPLTVTLSQQEPTLILRYIPFLFYPNFTPIFLL